MDAARYFEMMHRAMSARKRDTTLLLRVKVQDLGGADAYLELRQEPGSGRVRLFYSTMGRRNLNFQLFRKGWQLCHNASGEMTGRFPAKADELLSADDFAAYIRDDALDAGRAERVLHELRRCSGDHTAALPRNAWEGALITVDSFVGRGAHWCYWSTDAATQLPMAAVLCWLGDFLAGTERRTLQSCPEAVQLAAQWQADLASPFACPVDRMPQPMAPAAPAAVRRASAQPVQNPRWQSILAVLATV